MNWEAIGAVGEVLGALGVIVTLGYLAVQIRHNTRSVRSATAQSAFEVIVGMNSVIGSDRAVAELVFAGVVGTEELDAIDRTRFTLLISNTFLSAETMYLQDQSGLIDTKFWESRERYLLNLIAAPGVHSFWQRNRENFGAEFRQYIDSHVREPQ